MSNEEYIGYLSDQSFIAIKSILTDNDVVEKLKGIWDNIGKFVDELRDKRIDSSIRLSLDKFSQEMDLFSTTDFIEKYNEFMNTGNNNEQLAKGIMETLFGYHNFILVCDGSYYKEYIIEK